MTEELIVGQAVETAWSVYLATHGDVDKADQRRCSLARYLRAEFEGGEKDMEGLACSGLAYLTRLSTDAW